MKPSDLLTRSGRRLLFAAIAILAVAPSGWGQKPHPLPIPNACAPQPDGPPPCKDSDGDGLCDSWEHAHRIPGGPLLPDSDPKRPDVYVWYDWMGYGLDGESCAVDSDCTALGLGHRGETCGVVGSQYEGSCTYACTTNSDCTSRWPTEAHRGERCISNACQHTHDPLLLDDRSLDLVVHRFAEHGINLHLLRGRARPHSHVVSFRTDEQMDLSCEGGSLPAGNVGVGKYAVSLYDLKPAEASPLAYHYALFAHYVGCDSSAHCPASDPEISTCTNRTLAWGQSGLAELSGSDFVVSLGGLINNSAVVPRFVLASSFMHELGHNFGLRHDGHLDRACKANSDCSGGDTCFDLGDGQGAVCHETVGGVLGREEPNYKPNYLSIMNYAYEKNGIEIGTALGSRQTKACHHDSECGFDGAVCRKPPVGGHCSLSWRICSADVDCPTSGESCVPPASPGRTCSMSAYSCNSDLDCNAGESCVEPSASGVCVRLDYSRQTLPVGGATPGFLDEANLNDAPGLGSGTTDIFRYTDGACHYFPLPAATTGPVNWAGAGLAVSPSGDFFHIGPESFTDMGVYADVDGYGICNGQSDILHGHTDWPDFSGIPFNYKFQCTPSGILGMPRTHVNGTSGSSNQEK